MIVLIVDDDRLVRFSIKSMLKDFMEESEDLFLEATNGRDMVEVCRDKKPDVVFADISMPYMNGLDAIAECKKYSPITQYVIVSGYSDFEYAQKGIHLGVSDYLLKPVDCEKLKAVVEKLKTRMDEKQQELNSRFQLQVMESFNYFASLGVQEKTGFTSQKYHCLVFLLYVRDGDNKKQSLDFQKIMVKEIIELGEGIVSRKGHYAITNTSEGTVCIIFDVANHLEDYVLSHMNKICFDINQRYKSLYYVRWNQCETLQAVYRVSEQADSETSLLIDRIPGVLYDGKQLARNAYEKEFLMSVEKLIEAWKQADGMVCKDIINKIWRKYREKEPRVDLRQLSEYCSSVCECPICGESFKSFFRSFVEHSEQMYCGFGKEESDLMDTIKQYIQKNYMYDISISQIAEQFGLTANYLSTIFKRKTGEKFIDYLTKQRLEAGKRLLVQNSSASVQDISLMVGYNSSRHFSTLFQKYTGETPSSYRKNRL